MSSNPYGSSYGSLPGNVGYDDRLMGDFANQWGGMWGSKGRPPQPQSNFDSGGGPEPDFYVQKRWTPDRPSGPAESPSSQASQGTQVSTPGTPQGAGWNPPEGYDGPVHHSRNRNWEAYQDRDEETDRAWEAYYNVARNRAQNIRDAANMKMFEAAADQFGLDANAMAQIWKDSNFEDRPYFNQRHEAQARKRRAWNQMFKPGYDAEGNVMETSDQRKSDRWKKHQFFKKWMGADMSRGRWNNAPGLPASGLPSTKSMFDYWAPGSHGPINRYFGLPYIGPKMGYRPGAGTSHRKNMRDWEMNRWVREGQLQGENRTWHDPYILKSQGLDWRDPAYGYMDAAGEWLV